MSANSTLARPYAKAAFEYAKQHNLLKEWSMILQYAAAVIIDPAVAKLLNNPRVGSKKVADFVVQICDKVLTVESRNFIKLLGENKRLNVLPEITKAYEIFRDEVERQMQADVISAFPLSASEQQQLAKALEKRLDRQVTLRCEVDKNLLGGAIIRAGDLVIDGSARGKLARLATMIKA